MKLDPNAVVVGASLAGLMAAIALARAGIKVTVVERAGSMLRSGAILQVDSGEADHTATAKFLRKLASGGIRSAEAWSSIQSRLRAAAEAEPNIELRYEVRVIAVDEDDNGAWAVTNQGEIIRGDILLGADGHRSTVRRHLNPHKPDATFAGYLIWVALLEENDIPEKYRPAPNAPLLSIPDGIGDFLLGSIIAGADGSTQPGKRRLGWAWYDNTRNDLLRRLSCVQGNIVQHSLTPADIPEETLTELAEEARARWRQTWLAATLHSIKTRNLIATPIAEYIPKKLAQGRIAIIGDAAHLATPLTAKGFNASLQDAATVADCVASGIKGSGAVEALLKYQSRRLSNAREIVQSGQSFSRSFGRK